MPTRRAPASPRAQAAPSPSAQAASPMLTAALVLAAVGYGMMLLIDRRELSWPPRELMGSLATIAGCLAMVGPLLLWRRGGGEATLGELTWIVGGLLLWSLNLAALARGQTRGVDWASPIGPELLGPVALAVLIGGWRTGRAAWSWTWTGVTGWVLGLLWIGLGVLEMLPQDRLPFLPR